jgi:ABC-type sugar transport system ATPase subunit
MPETIKISSRILVFKDHRVVGEIGGVDDGTKTYEQVSAEIGRHLH